MGEESELGLRCLAVRLALPASASPNLRQVPVDPCPGTSPSSLHISGWTLPVSEEVWLLGQGLSISLLNIMDGYAELTQLHWNPVIKRKSHSE